MCDNDAERARKMSEEGFKFFSYALGHHYAFGQHQPGKTNIWNNFKSSPMNLPGMDGSNSCVGSPEQVRTRLREFEDAGVDQVVFISQAGNNRHEDICSSLSLFAEKVMPEFKEREQTRARSEGRADGADSGQGDEAQTRAEDSQQRRTGRGAGRDAGVGAPAPLIFHRR